MIDFNKSSKYDYSTHKEIHQIIYNILAPEFNIRDFRRVLKRAVVNYRCDKGIALSREGFEILKEKGPWKFCQFPFEIKFFDSKFMLILDQASSPYFIDSNKTLWLSDEIQITQFSLTDNQNEFLNSLK